MTERLIHIRGQLPTEALLALECAPLTAEVETIVDNRMDRLIPYVTTFKGAPEDLSAVVVATMLSTRGEVFVDYCPDVSQSWQLPTGAAGRIEKWTRGVIKVVKYGPSALKRFDG